MTRPLSNAAIVAHLWQARGWGVYPCQPDSKRVIPGYGPHKRVLLDSQEIEHWLRERVCNLAVVAPEGGIILDFDTPNLYEHWNASHPDASYTEITPRGGYHVFGYVDSVATAHPLAGVEFKRSVLVWPSRVAGVPYQLGKGEIERLAPDALAALCVEKPKQSHDEIASSLNRSQGATGLIASVKAAWPLVEYLATFEPGLSLARMDARWITARCPWHEDSHASFWIDTERNLWGCHACGEHGDVINWHAKRTGASCADAARDLARREGARV